MSAVDDAVARVERWLILACVAGMTVLVGADVVQRTFSRPVGKTEEFLRFVSHGAVGHGAANAVFGAFALVFFVFAAHASRQVTAERSGHPPPKLLGSSVLGVAALVVVLAAVKALLWAFPSSVPGAQKFALGLMLWAGMLGASMATRERRHIVLDAVTKKLDAAARRPFALLSGAATAAFCLFVSYLGFVQVAGEIREWATHEGTGLYESLPIPTWIATLAIPVSFFLMGARFLAYAVRDFRHGPPAPPSEAAAEEALAAARGAETPAAAPSGAAGGGAGAP